MTAIPDIETQGEAEIRRFQEKKLQEALHYAATHSPYYKALFERHAVTIDNAFSFDNLSHLPVTTKDDLQKNNWEFLCVPREQIVEFTSTSGTLGRPVTIALTENDLRRLAYNEAISFECADGSSSDLYQLMLTLDRQFMAGIAYYQGIRKLGAGIIRVGPGLPAQQWETIERLKPTVLVAVPSFIVKLIEFAVAQGIDLNTSSVKKAICIGESLRDENLELNALGKRIREQWDIHLYGTYASTEMQTAFTECNQGNGGHHHPDLIVVELLDDENKPVPRGQAGEVTITSLGVEGMPLVRYKTGDVATAFYEPCACGRKTMRLGPVLGRHQQMIKLKGTTIYPPGIFDILNQLPDLKDYVVEVYSSELGTDEIRLFLFTEGNQQELAENLRVIFQSRLRVVPSLEFVDHAEIEKLQLGEKTRKVKKFIDRRK
jgi:phenylacetate-CoA ligase